MKVAGYRWSFGMPPVWQPFAHALIHNVGFEKKAPHENFRQIAEALQFNQVRMKLIVFARVCSSALQTSHPQFANES
jgi:hypothetical protein